MDASTLVDKTPRSLNIRRRQSEDQSPQNNRHCKLSHPRKKHKRQPEGLRKAGSSPASARRRDGQRKFTVGRVASRRAIRMSAGVAVVQRQCDDDFRSFHNSRRRASKTASPRQRALRAKPPKAKKLQNDKVQEKLPT